MKYTLALLTLAVAVACGVTKEPMPPWDQETQFEQATERLEGFRIVDKRLLAWAREIREVRDSKRIIRFDSALLWFEIENAKEGRYLVIAAVRSPASTDDRWEPNSVISDGFDVASSSYFPGYEFFHARPRTKDLWPLASRWMAETHVMKKDWRIATGEEPPAVP
jgi:hypothetical protein